MSEQMYRLTITAVGEVRDEHGNLVERVPVDEHIDLTHEELQQYLGKLKE